MQDREPVKNTNGDIRMSVKYIHPEQYSYLLKICKEKNLTQTAIINQALKLHEEKENGRPNGQ